MNVVEANLEDIYELLDDGASLREIGPLFDVSHQAIHKFIKHDWYYKTELDRREAIRVFPLRLGIKRCAGCNKLFPLKNFYASEKKRGRGWCDSCNAVWIKNKYRTDEDYRKHVSKICGRWKIKQGPIYGKWAAIRQRCYNKKNKAYKYYGEKGIGVDKEWWKFKNFKQWCLENGWKEGLHLDRINSNKNYSPDNCQFLDASSHLQKTWKDRRKKEQPYHTLF